jgi:SpoVK/Ycf46/Vps4 family AAA+-type ATPase
VDNHDLIFKQWGFEEVFEKGTAISLLFFGPPGTGKTLMAQAIADKFGYKLQMISTAEIETPEPGGAERNLKKYFTEANTANSKTVLLFDECDSLITDRKRVGMIIAAQINALLSELERFTGIAIFTTNRLETLDPAFDRRLSLKLEFPMPDAAHRILIWKRMFPSKAPLASNIRWEKLARVEIAGGHIKNVVLKAARMAAAQKATEITDDILWDCLEQEVESLDAYKEALDSNKQVFGTPLPNAGQDLVRERGRIKI